MAPKNGFWAAGGNSAVEMLLFAPLALMFVAAAIDGGLSFSEKAAIADALRSGLSATAGFARARPVVSFDDDVSTLESSAALESLLQQAAAQIAANVARIQGLDDYHSQDSFRVTVAAVLLQIDEQSGAALNRGTLHLTKPHILPSSGAAFDLESRAPHFDHRSPSRYLHENLPLDGAPCAYAIPLGGILQPNGAVEERYLGTSVVIYAEVTGLTRGLHSRLTSQLLGGVYAVQEQQLLLLRNPLG